MQVILVLALLVSQAQIEIQLNQASGQFRVTGWPEAGRNSEQWPAMFNVYVDSGTNLSDLPPLSGQHTIANGDLVFSPRYPLTAGVRYKAVLRLPGREPLIRNFDTPKPDLTPTTTVEHIYPSAGVLPENQLKFYIHFSASMSRGEAYRRIHLLNESGKPVEMPFLELEQELWDTTAQRITVFFDPGRIKRDVLPNEEIGPSIVAGRKYSLVIDKEWLDAEGKTLKTEVRKDFSVGPADRMPMEIQSWKIAAPERGTRNALVVDFPEPLDHALMLRDLEVLDGAGNALKGSIETDREETRWTFRPEKPWSAGNYALQVGTNISDLAGNMIGRTFEIDRFDAVTERIVRETQNLQFRIK